MSKIEKIINEEGEKITLLRYFYNASKQNPFFLGDIKEVHFNNIRKYVKMGLIKTLKPRKSCVFRYNKIDEDYHKHKEENIITSDDEDLNSILSALGSYEDEDEKTNEELDLLRAVFEYFRKECSGSKFNERTSYCNGEIKEKIMECLKQYSEENSNELFNIFVSNGYYKEYSPAKVYYLSELGKKVCDAQLEKERRECGEDIIFSEEVIEALKAAAPEECNEESVNLSPDIIQGLKKLGATNDEINICKETILMLYSQGLSLEEIKKSITLIE